MSYLEHQADLLMNNVYGYEQRVLKRIGERVKEIGKMSVADAQALNNIAFVRGDMKSVIQDMARMTGQNIKDVQIMYADLIDSQHGATKVLHDYRGKTFVPLADNDALKALVNAYANTTAETMINLSKTSAMGVGFIDKNGKFHPLEKAYIDTLDKAVMQVATGASDYNMAMRDAMEQLGGSGLRVNYGGITRRLDTAVRQSVLWGAKQASNEYYEQLGRDLECDGIEIDWHGNPRPSHAFMQGKQYALGHNETVNGKKYEGALDARSPISGKNVYESLEDYNCYHFSTPIILGVSEPTYSEQELARLNAKNERKFTLGEVAKTGYEWSQDMRKLETAIREERSRKVAVESAVGKEAAKEHEQRIKAMIQKYNEIADVCGITPNYNRMGIVREKK